MNPRLTAVKLLLQVTQHGRSLDHAFNEMDPKRLTPLVKAYCFGVCRWFTQLEAIADQLLQKPLKNKDRDIYLLLLIGIYQLLHMDTADHAAINETVNGAKALKKIWATKLINACLRRCLREKEKLLSALGNKQYAHPDWLLYRLKQAWPNDWEAIVEANNTQAPMSLRVNVAKISRGEYLGMLTEYHPCSPGCHPRVGGDLDSRLRGNDNPGSSLRDLPGYNNRIIETCVQLPQPINISDLPHFNNGFVSVQDFASQCVAPLLKLNAHDVVLDACSAPGGKACHLLEMYSDIQLTALDISEQRLQKVQQNLDRLQLNAKLIACDALDLKTWWNQTHFDAILLDAPCSATGVIRRHPDIKLLRREDDIDSLAHTQLQLLQTLWKTLKPGGQLLYTTCSVLPDENVDVIKTFLQDSNATHEKITLPIGEACEFGWQCLPQIHGHDGFYYCLIKKPNS